MFAFFKTLDNVSKKDVDFLKNMGVLDVTIEKFSQKQEGAAEIESRIIVVGDSHIWEVYKQDGKIMQRGLRLDKKSYTDAYAYLVPRSAQRRLAMFVAEENKMIEEDSIFSLF